MFHIASFYRFTSLDDHARLRAGIVEVCRDNAVKGTILLAPEGLNGTIAGSEGGVEAVLAHLRADPRLEAMAVRWATSDEDPFLRLKVRLKREIVSLGVGHVDPSITATRVPAADWNDLVREPGTIVVDTRNAYEVAIGTFQGAVNPGTESFTDFPAWIEASGIDRDAPIAMFCTGGIRCEKASAWLTDRGYSNLFQLDGGVLAYLEQIDASESLWDGECYVFDRRVSVGHGLVPGAMEICPNCNTVVDDAGRAAPGYRMGVMCGDCHNEISQDRMERFTERQKQIDLATARGTTHLGRST
ncbi:MAG TPA: rhodanese-related sulfurtransferase [Acidimicrobiia bacterium]|nr:rhodanese-related sulfurtransferase [Acidimicrobiia bacterium]